MRKYIQMEKIYSFPALFLVVCLSTVYSQVTDTDSATLVTNCNWTLNSTGKTVLKSPAVENQDLVLNSVCRAHLDAYYERSLRMKVLRFNLTGPSECRQNSEKFSLDLETSPSNKIVRLEWCGSMYPEELILSPNVPGIDATYNLGSYGAGPGFEIEFTYDFTSVCYMQKNMIASTEPKLLYSPYHPSVYKNNMDCGVTIRNVNGQPIWIRSLLMDIENQTTCNYDYLIINGVKYCGSNPIDVVLNVATVQIRFHTDDTRTYSGYILQYGTVPAESSCEVRNLTADTANNYYYYSPTGSECYEWHISTRFGRGEIALNIDTSRLGASNFCLNSTSSYVAIYDGPYSTSPQMAFLCGSQPITTYLSSFSSLTVVYRSVTAMTDYFYFSYNSSQDYNQNTEACTVTNLTADVMRYNSLGTASLQTASQCYEWHITTKYGSGHVTLDLVSFTLRDSNSCTISSNSYVAIYDGPSTNSSLVTILCGQKYSGSYHSSSYSMTVVYRTSDRFNSDAFRFSYSSSGDYYNDLSSCTSSNYYAEASTKYLVLPNDLSNYSIRSVCYAWHISTRNGNEKVSLNLISFHVGSEYPCTTLSSSYVAVYDGPFASSPQKAFLCGYKYGGYYMSSSNSMTVVYRTSDPSSEYFNFTYSSVLDYLTTTEIYSPPCTVRYLTAGTSYNYIRSSDINISPTGNTCYQWYISTYYNYRKVSLDLSSFRVGESYSCTNASSSYVAIYDGSSTTSPQMAILCGRLYSSNYLSSSSSMTIVFHTSSPTSDNFSLRYISTMDYLTTPEATSCNYKHLTAESSKQYLDSSDVSSSLTRSQCSEWHISTLSGSGRVSLDLRSFSLMNSYPCTTSSSSYVAIYEGSTSSSTPTNILCGSQYSGTFQSSSSSMTVVYRTSDFSIEYFSFKYSSLSDDSYDAFSPGIDKGAVVGIIFGSVIGFLIIVGILLFAVRWHRRKRMLSESRENLFTNPTSTTAANTHFPNSNISMISSPTPFNNGPPPYCLLPHQNFDSAPPPYSSLQFGDIPHPTAPSYIIPSAPRASTIGVAPPAYSVAATNQLTQLVQNPGPDSVKPEVAEGVGCAENPAYFSYTNPVATEAVTAQE